MRERKALPELLASLSLANLMFLRLWMKLLPYKSGSSYTLAYSPFNSYLAVMLNVVLWGGAFLLLLRLSGRSPRAYPWTVLAIFSLVTVAGGYGVGLSCTSLSRLTFLYGGKKVLGMEIAGCLAAVAGGGLMLRYRERAARLCVVLALILSPFLLVTFSQAVVALARLEPATRFQRHRVDPAGKLTNPLKSSVVWMIFDETDYRLCFEQRPAELSLPAFDRLRANALWASRAYSPSDATMVSLPALLTGMPLTTTETAGANRLNLIPLGSHERRDFAAQETIFDRIKKRQGSTALFGWYHPYSRVLQGIDLCRDYPSFNFFTSDDLSRVLFFQWAEVFDYRFNPFKNSVQGDGHIGIVTGMQSDVLSTVRGQDPSFMFLHYPVPHLPAIYDRKTGLFGTNRSIRDGYLDNMALADRYLGELRAELERRGTWDGALVIVSSDHHWRANTYDGRIDYEHVPFIVKLPHQRQGISYDGRFNTVLTQDLILAVLDGGVKSPENACRWLDQAAKRAPYGKKVIFSGNQPDPD